MAIGLRNKSIVDTEYLGDNTASESYVSASRIGKDLGGAGKTGAPAGTKGLGVGTAIGLGAGLGFLGDIFNIASQPSGQTTTVTYGPPTEDFKARQRMYLDLVRAMAPNFGFSEVTYRIKNKKPKTNIAQTTTTDPLLLQEQAVKGGTGAIQTQTGNLNDRPIGFRS